MECNRAVQLRCTGLAEEPAGFIFNVDVGAGSCSETSAHTYQTTLCYLQSSGMLCSVDWYSPTFDGTDILSLSVCS